MRDRGESEMPFGVAVIAPAGRDEEVMELGRGDNGGICVVQRK
jgi:hypothetical protein